VPSAVVLHPIPPPINPDYYLPGLTLSLAQLPLPHHPIPIIINVYWVLKQDTSVTVIQNCRFSDHFLVEEGKFSVAK
jgi:hypothetical protein